MTQSEKNSKPKKKITTWVKIIGSSLCGALFIWLLAQQDWRTIGEALKQLDPIIWAIVFVLHVLHAVLNATRWYVLLQAQSLPLSFGKSIRLQFAGLFASNFLPSSIGGDVVRVFGLRQTGSDLSLGLASIVVDRLVNIIGVVFFLPATLIVFLPLVRSGELSLSAAGFGTLWTKTRQWLAKFLTSLQFWLKKPGSLIVALLITFIAVFALCVSHYLLAIGLGMEVTFLEVVAIRTLSYFIMMIPISLNGLGLREIGITTLYIAAGATQAQAVSFSLITRLFLTLRTLPGALWVSPAFANSKKRTNED